MERGEAMKQLGPCHVCGAKVPEYQDYPYPGHHENCTARAADLASYAAEEDIRLKLARVTIERDEWRTRALEKAADLLRPEYPDAVRALLRRATKEK